MTIHPLLSESQRHSAERLLDRLMSSAAHRWQGRPGLDDGGLWPPSVLRRHSSGSAAVPRLRVAAALDLYRALLEIYRLSAELMAHFASYAVLETEWRDLKVAGAALMLVQSHVGALQAAQPDYRAVGQGMMLFYQKGSRRMLTPREVLRIGQLLETPEIAALNRAAGFGEPGGHKPPLGRWKSAAARWLRARENNLPLLEGLVTAGYKETIKALARKAGYKPQSPAFFQVLGWKQKQAPGGHRTVGLAGLTLSRHERLEEVSEAEAPTLDGLALPEDDQITARRRRAHRPWSSDQRATAGQTGLELMFLLDKSGSMQGGLARSRVAAAHILGAFPPHKVHLATFDTVGDVLHPAGQAGTSVPDRLRRLSAGGGTNHGAAVVALHEAGVRITKQARLVVLVAGDEAGEDGGLLAATFRQYGYQVAAMALICAAPAGRGNTVRTAAQVLEVPFAELEPSELEDPSRVPGVLCRLLEEAVPTRFPPARPRRGNWVDEVLSTPLLDPDGRPVAFPPP